MKSLSKELELFLINRIEFFTRDLYEISTGGIKVLIFSHTSKVTTPNFHCRFHADLITGQFDRNKLNYTPLCRINNCRGDSVNTSELLPTNPAFPCCHRSIHGKRTDESMTHPRYDLIQKGIATEGRPRSSRQFVQQIKSDQRDTRVISDSPTRPLFTCISSRSYLHIHVSNDWSVSKFLKLITHITFRDSKHFNMTSIDIIKISPSSGNTCFAFLSFLFFFWIFSQHTSD